MTATTEGDLTENWSYIAAESSEDIATRFLSDIEAKFARLLHSKSIGSRREHFGAGVRVIFSIPYAIYYVPHDQQLIIVRVLHSARDTAAIADKGGFDE